MRARANERPGTKKPASAVTEAVKRKVADTATLARVGGAVERWFPPVGADGLRLLRHHLSEAAFGPTTTRRLRPSPNKFRQ
jgi:hypothetical protein